MSAQPGPYAPPRAAVADARIIARRRPVSIYIALLAICLGLGMSMLVWWGLFRFRHTMYISPSLLLWPIANCVVTLITGYHIWRGRNWARFLYLGLALLVVAATLRRFWKVVLDGADLRGFIADPIAMLVFFLQPLLALLALLLLFLPARAWFDQDR